MPRWLAAAGSGATAGAAGAWQAEYTSGAGAAGWVRREESNMRAKVLRSTGFSLRRALAAAPMFGRLASVSAPFTMATTAHALGQAGEAFAAAFYQQAGYEVLARGYRHGRAEVDLIVRRGHELLVFVEVKTRSGGQFGPPETFVSARKKELFRLAATHLQEELAWAGDIRFDILALTQLSTGFRAELFEDAFY